MSEQKTLMPKLRLSARLRRSVQKKLAAMFVCRF